MVYASLSNSAIPETGKGRWSISPRIYKDTAFKKTVRKTGLLTTEKLRKYIPEQTTIENNPQAIYAELKHLIMTEARIREQAMDIVMQES